jgi:hypothetical protein
MTAAETLPVDIDAALLALPIRPANLPALTAIRGQVAALGKDRDDWRYEFNLYASSWLRRLGGRIFQKRHRIDALAMTTEHQRIGYERALAAGLIGEAYGSGSQPPPGQAAAVERVMTIVDEWFCLDVWPTSKCNELSALIANAIAPQPQTDRRDQTS